jgi:anti-sigma regulatory factor (Ser/Thr protein kinase)
MASPATAKHRSLGRLNSTTTFEGLANEVARLCAEIAHAEICTIWRVFADGTTQHLKLAGAHGIVAPQTIAQEVVYPIAAPGQEKYEGLTSYIASNRESVRVNSFEDLVRDYGSSRRGAMDAIQWQGTPSSLMRDLYGMPVMLGGELEGVLKVENRIGNDVGFTDDDVQALHEFAEVCALVLKVLILTDSYEQRLLEAPVQLSDALVQRPFQTDAAQDIVNATAHALNAGICSLWLVDENHSRLIHHASVGVQGNVEKIPFYRIDINPPDTKEGDRQIDGVTAWVAIRRRSFWANTHAVLRQHPSWRGTWDDTMYGDRVEQEFHSMYAVPLVWNKELLGVLKVENSIGQKFFSQNDRRKCDLMANYVVLLLALTRQLRLQLIPSIAHNLGNPARAIARNLEMLIREVDKPEPSIDRIRVLARMSQSASFTLATMSRTLAAEVAQQGGAQQWQATDIVELFRETMLLVRPLLPQTQSIAFRCNTAELVLQLTPSEQVWLQIILFNLLNNASRYGPASGEITLGCEVSPAGTRVYVADQGAGVAPKDRIHIFEPGFRASKVGKGEGLGLGLYEVKRLVDLLKWQIVLEDEKPHGARFEVSIPESWRQTHA